ncbi:uncharacterized protein LOC142785149 isoform X2 [Rhipicephalus microplus]
MDGKCVPYDQCGAHANRHVDIKSGKRLAQVGDPPGETSKSMAVLPPEPVAVPADADKEETARQLIQSPNNLELLMMSTESYVHDTCLCLTSTRLADTPKGAERTINCYDYRTWFIAAPAIKHLEGNKKLLKITRDTEVNCWKHSR